MSRPLAVLPLLALLASSLASAAPREELSLNGSWQCIQVKDLAAAAPTSGWQAISIPGYFWGYNYERAWLKRTFTVPASMVGKRLALHFGGVKYNSTVYVNGQKVGGQFNGFVPFECDITAAAKVGAANELLVSLYDWTGVFRDNKTDFKTKFTEVREVPRNNVLGPVGGMVDAYGIWDAAKLVARPQVCVKDVFIKPSVRQKKLVLDYTLANDSAKDATVTLGAQALDAGRPALSVPARAVTVPAGQTVKLSVAQPWPDAHYWSFEDPHLYHLVTTLAANGVTVDTLSTRFGFREVWTQGHRVYLNGVPCSMLATSWWPPRDYETREQIADTMRKIKAGNCRIFRTHTQPWVEQYYDVADEVGLMMVPEGPVWNDTESYRVNDPEFWKNYAACLQAMVERDRNHPSVVLWSLENEFYGAGVNNQSENRKDLARLGTMVKQLDPTRPIYYESNGDPEGVADLIGLHYPHEYPDYNQWPNTAYWLDTPLPSSWFYMPGAKPFVYDRKKPVYIGEFLWIPTSNPAGETMWFGDEAYLDYTKYHVMGKGLSWRDAIRAYRHYEIAGISPWTMIEGGRLDASNACYAEQQRAMQPVVAFIKEYDHSFFSGDMVTRSIDAYNDTLTPRDIEFSWGLMVAPPAPGAPWPAFSAPPRGGNTLHMAAGEHRQFTITFRAPTVQARMQMTLFTLMQGEGTMKGYDHLPCTLSPRPTKQPSPPARIALYDPSGATAKVLDTLGVRYSPVTSPLPKAGASDVFIIGANSLVPGAKARPVIGKQPPLAGAITDFLAVGGRVLVLEQNAYPDGALPVGLDTAFSSTMTFAQMPSHPALAGIAPEDLKYWRGDNLVTAGEPLRPAGGELPIIVSGCAGGLTHAPLLELPRGKGTIMLCQMRCISKAATEPTATILLRNLVTYLSAYDTGDRPEPRPERRDGDVGHVGPPPELQPWPRTGITLVNAKSPSVTRTLDEIGVAYRVMPETLSGNALRPAKVLLYEGAAARKLTPDSVAWDFAAAGGNILLHNLTPADYEALRPMLGGSLKLVAHHSVARRTPAAHPLSEFIRNEDTYWLGPHVGISWSQTPLSYDMCDYAFTKTLDGLKYETYNAQDMRIEGEFNTKQARGVILATGGYVRTDIDFPRDGRYVFGVLCSGSPYGGIYPSADIVVDGKVVGSIAENDGEWRTYTTFGEVTKGKHEVAIHFNNDAGNAVEDRNMLIDKLFVARDTSGPHSEVFLTNPGALAVIPLGKGLVVVDEIKWDTEQENRIKAQRLIGGLLTGLGAQFSGIEGTVLPCGDWTPEPGMPYYSNAGGMASLACMGYISTKVECAQAGRYVLRITAGGSVAAGEYPAIRVDVNGKTVGEVKERGGALQPYPIVADLPAGPVELKLTFTNDLQVNGEDRNLVVDKVVVVPEGR